MLNFQKSNFRTFDLKLFLASSEFDYPISLYEKPRMCKNSVKINFAFQSISLNKSDR